LSITPGIEILFLNLSLPDALSHKERKTQKYNEIFIEICLRKEMGRIQLEVGKKRG